LSLRASGLTIFYYSFPVLTSAQLCEGHSTSPVTR
jgi:hypothetical protein